MADVNANIDVNIDTSNALAQIKSLQRQLSQFYTSIAKSSETAALAQRNLQKNLVNGINSLGAFSAEMRTIKTTAESFTDSLEKNKFSMREYFRYAGASTKTFGRLFKSEFDTISKVAEENVKRLQTQYIKLGRDSSGAMKAIAVIPKELNMQDFGTKTQLAAQKQALFNQLIKQGSTNLLNFGKNTQWAGRQLMVGFTIPLTILGNTAAKTFMEMEAAALKFRKVYGDLFTPKAETDQALADVQALGQMFTKYGVAVSQTVGLAAEAAAAGFQGVDLQRQTTEATRLSVLGQIEAQKALETTISLQNAFKMSSESLASSIDFLNAVENQTVVSLDDITTAIPKVAPVIQQLGGDVKDLAFFMAAMKEGGINASEGANALKSGLGALINPTEKAAAMLANMGVNIKQIVEANKGDIKGIVIGFAQALDTLDPLTRARAIEQLFGKFQFARLSTLFDNVTNSTGQAARVLDLAGTSVEELASLSSQELGMTADSAMNKFRKSVEDLKFQLVPLGKTFLEAVTPIVEFLGGILEKFNNLSDGTKKAITVLTVAIGAIGPVALMTFGLLANGLANIIKLFLTLRQGYLRLTGQSQMLGEQTQFLTVEQQNAAAVAHSLDQAHAKLTQQFNVETAALNNLIAAYQRANTAAKSFAMNNPGMMVPGRKKYAKGVVSVPGPKGAGDVVPAMLSPGEAVIPADMAKKYGALINGMVSGNIPGYEDGLTLAGAKHKSKLFSAPSVVQAQTEKMTWSTLAKELEAVDRAAEEFNLTLAENKKLTNEQINNMKRVTAAHKEADVFTTSVGDKEMTVKNWRAANLMPDTGPNTFLNTVLQTKGVMENFEKTGLDTAAQQLGLSMEEAKAELDKLKRGIQPQTRAGAGMLGQLGAFAAAQPATASNVGGRFQGAATAAIMTERLKGDYYETMGSRTYDPSKDVKATEQVLGRVKKVRMLVLKETEEAATAALAALRRRLGISSPSKETMKIGEQMAQGLKIGIEKGTPGVVAASEAMSTKAVAGTKRGYRKASSAGGTVGAGGIIIPPGTPPTGGAEGPMFGPRKPTRFDRTAGKFAGRLRGKTSKLKGFAGGGAGYAASSALLAGSFLPGKAGEVAGQAATAAFGIQALSAVLKLPIPHLKVFAAGLAVTVGLVKLVNAARERERFAIEGLGDAATLSSDKLKTLGDFFGVVPKSTPLERTGPSLVVNQETRGQLDALKQDKGFKKDFAKDIAALKQATDKQAELIFNSLAIQLKGKGFAAEQIDLILKALQEEAGKTSLKVQFSNIDLTTKAGQQELQATLGTLGKSLGKEFSKGYSAETKSAINRANGEVITWTEESISKGLKKNLATTSKIIGGMLNGISGQLESGAITAKQFDESFGKISQTISNMPEPQSALLLGEILKNLPGDLAKTALGLQNTSNKLLLVEAAMLGVATITPAMIAALKAAETSTDGGAQRAAGRVKRFIKDEIADLKELREIVAKELGSGTGKGDGEESAFSKLKKQLTEQRKEVYNSIAAFNKLKAAGIDTARAMELSKDPLLAMVLNSKLTKEQFKEIIKLVKLLDKGLDKGAFKDFINNLRKTNEINNNFTGLVSKFKQLGLEAEDIEGLLNDPQILDYLLDGTISATEQANRMKAVVDQITAAKVIRLKFLLENDPMQLIKDTSDKAQEFYANEEAAARIRMESTDAWQATVTAIEKANEAIKKGEDAIAQEQAAIDALEYQLKYDPNIGDQVIRDIELQIRAQQDLIRIEQDKIAAIEDQIRLEQDKIDKLNEQIDASQKIIDETQRYLELNFDRPIQKLQEESDILSNNLDLISRQEDAINKKYDEQADALSKVLKINQQISNQKKQQISLADALTQGDISAAASIAQEMQAANAEAAIEAQQGAMDAARQSELGAVTAGGMTRGQIEERQFQITQQIFALEQQRKPFVEAIRAEEDKIYATKLLIEPLEKKIAGYNLQIEGHKRVIEGHEKNIEGFTRSIEDLERKREALTDKIRQHQANIDKINKEDVEPAKVRLKQAQDSQTAMEKIMKATVDNLPYLGLTRKDWEAIEKSIAAGRLEGDLLAKATAAMQADVAAAVDKWATMPPVKDLTVNISENITRTINEIVYRTVIETGGGTGGGGGGAGGGGGGGGSAVAVAMGGMIKRKSFAFGGTARGSDTVPAMLTPGEFVVNRAATARFKPLLETINQGGYPALSQPRYSVSNNAGAPAQSVSKSPGVVTSVSSSPVYNYSLNVNVSGTDVDEYTIANTVMAKIQQMSDRQIKRQVVY